MEIVAATQRIAKIEAPPKELLLSIVRPIQKITKFSGKWPNQMVSASGQVDIESIGSVVDGTNN